jgi:hypothetical protein
LSRSTTDAPPAATGAAPVGARRWRTLLGLGPALVAAGVLLALPQPKHRAQPAATGPLSLVAAWPTAAPTSVPGQLPDGTAYTPLTFLDARTSLGSALTADGDALRLLVRLGDAAPIELRRLPRSINPQFTAFAADQETVYWAESSADAAGHATTTIMATDRGWASPVRPLTTDTGDVIFFNSQYDLVVADGQVHWAAAARSAEPVTEVRAVGVNGGAVTVRRVPGAYAQSAWPWLVSAGSGQTGPVDMVNLVDDRRVRVPAAPSELVTCSPVWCRVLILASSGGRTRFDLMHPDGSQRRRMAGGSANAALVDVALLDRFEALVTGGSDSATVFAQPLLLHDLRSGRTVEISAGAGTVESRGGVLWWSTGDNETLAWHALDLHSLA